MLRRSIAPKEREREITRVGAALYLRCLINQVERTRRTAFPCGLSLSLSLSLSVLVLVAVSPCLSLYADPPSSVIQGHNKRVALSPTSTPSFLQPIVAFYEVWLLLCLETMRSVGMIPLKITKGGFYLVHYTEWLGGKWYQPSPAARRDSAWSKVNTNTLSEGIPQNVFSILILAIS